MLTSGTALLLIVVVVVVTLPAEKESLFGHRCFGCVRNLALGEDAPQTAAPAAPEHKHHPQPRFGLATHFCTDSELRHLL
uniref:Putative secreted protein n=1 Tax=Anopheles marajoara TaxID=58244 RepID=A0A2M4CBQ5_9DIPT